jgi:hypothetical protein
LLRLDLVEPEPLPPLAELRLVEPEPLRLLDELRLREPDDDARLLEPEDEPLPLEELRLLDVRVAAVERLRPDDSPPRDDPPLPDERLRPRCELWLRLDDFFLTSPSSISPRHSPPSSSCMRM